MVNLPLIDAAGLTTAQRRGRECVACRKRWPRPSVAVGQTGSGDVLYRCADCLVTLEPAEPGQTRRLAAAPDSELHAGGSAPPVSNH